MPLSTLRSLALSLVTLAAVACGPTPTEPSHFAAFSQTDLRLGTGDEALAGREVTVHYTLWLYSATAANNKGPQIETSLGDGPFTFELGFGQVIRGWETGIVGMRVGGLRRLIIPPSQAYGPVRSGPVPPDSTLLFEIELLEVVE